MSLTYNALVSAIQGYVEDDGVEFTAQLPRIIENSCLTIAREVDAIGLNTITSVTCSLNNPTVPLPSDCFVIKTVAKVSNGQKKFIKHRPYDYLVEYWPDYASAGGNPNYYTRLNNTSLYVAPTATSTQDLEIRYVTVTIPSSTQDNYLLTQYPNLLLFKCVAEAMLVKKNMGDFQTWQGVYDREREAVENEARRNRRDDGFTPVQGKQNANNLKADSK